MSHQPRVYRVGPVEIDTGLGCVRRDGREVHLRPRPMQVLLHLVEQRHRLVSRDELLDRFWKDTAVTEDALAQCILDIRRVFEDSSRGSRVVKTIPKTGYRFIAPVDEVPLRPDPATVLVHAEAEITTELEIEEVISDAREHISSREALASLSRGLLPRRSRRLPIAAATVVAAVATVALLVWKTVAAPPASDTPKGSPAGVAGTKTIAVMYLENQSHSEALDWLREGLADALVANLSRAGGLAVLSRQELDLLLERINHSGNKVIDLKVALEVARRSHADVVAIGSFATSGERVRINVQLHDAGTGRLLVTETTTVTGSDQILEQADLLSIKLAAHMGAMIPVEAARGAPVQVMTRNLEAYRNYSLAVERAHALDYRAARALLDKAIALDPDFAMAHARVGYILVVGSELATEGKPHLERAFRLASRLTDKDRLLIAAWYAIANQDYGEAIRTLHQIVARYPAEMEAYLRLGLLLRGEERSDEAIQAFERGLAFAPDAVELLRQLGMLYADRGDHARAVQWLTRAVAVAPGVAMNHERLALVYRWAGRYQDAIASYQQALAFTTTFEPAVLGLGNVYVDLGRYREAIAQYRRHLDAIRPVARTNAFRFIQWIHLRLGDVDRAERIFAETKEPDQSFPWNAYLIAVQQGQKDRAERLTSILSTTSPRLAGGRRDSDRLPAVNRGRIALTTSQTMEALAQFQQAIRSRPTLANIESLEDCLANAYLDLGRLDEAIAEYQRVLRLNPNHALSRYHLALAYKRTGRLAESRTELARFFEIWAHADSDIPELVDARGKFEGLPRGATGLPVTKSSMRAAAANPPGPF